MGTGIIVCGLNGTGKSTLGKALAERLGYHFIDNENLYFPQAESYAAPRTREEAESLLSAEIQAHPDFVYATVKMAQGDAFYPCFRYAILIYVPRDIRLQRVRNRSLQKFGSRMLPGGDLYEQEEQFFASVAAKAEDSVENWIVGLGCPVLRVDGLRDVGENVDFIMGELETNQLLNTVL